MEIVQAMLDPSEYRASGAVITDDCRKLMTSFGKAMVVHCARESNAAAHRGKLSMEWRDYPPDFSIPSLVTDMIIV